MPPPSSGGVHIVQMLNILEDYPIGFLGANGADTIHLMAESMKLAYADRAKHLGDPDFHPVPVWPPEAAVLFLLLLKIDVKISIRNNFTTFMRN